MFFAGLVCTINTLRRKSVSKKMMFSHAQNMLVFFFFGKNARIFNSEKKHFSRFSTIVNSQAVYYPICNCQKSSKKFSCYIYFKLWYRCVMRLVKSRHSLFLLGLKMNATLKVMIQDPKFRPTYLVLIRG